MRARARHARLNDVELRSRVARMRMHASTLHINGQQEAAAQSAFGVFIAVMHAHTAAYVHVSSTWRRRRRRRRSCVVCVRVCDRLRECVGPSLDQRASVKRKERVRTVRTHKHTHTHTTHATRMLPLSEIYIAHIIS